MLLPAQLDEPLFHSSARDGEHREPVWAVRWRPGGTAAGRTLVFVSISSDGRLVEWALGKTGLLHEVHLGSCSTCQHAS